LKNCYSAVNVPNWDQGELGERVACDIALVILRQRSENVRVNKT
jgi:hypothetical protein